MTQETIAAISTAWGEAGIAIVRLSGTHARDMADSILSCTAPLRETRPRVLRNGFLLDECGVEVDHVLAAWFAAPHSYTGEDVAEIHTHGGTLVAQLCLRRLLSRGARLAEPGEFTKRAFLNGRIDLAQAEAVLGIIRSRSEEALRAAARTLRGELSTFAAGIRQEIVGLLAQVEAGLDFPEDDVPLLSPEELDATVTAIRQSLEDLSDRCSIGLILREGVRVAIVGKPNVGKSSLLNALLRESRAIVTAIPGTTRDLIEEVLTYRGIPIRLVDTAGICTPGDEVEAIGVAKARDALRDADLRILVLDGSAPLTETDAEIIDGIRDVPHLVARNKTDLPSVVTEEDIAELLPGSPVFSISASCETGLEALKDAIVAETAGAGTLDAGLNATARQVGEIRSALDSLSRAEEAIEAGLTPDVAASCLADALRSLDRLLGIANDDAVLDRVFRDFCIGK